MIIKHRASLNFKIRIGRTILNLGILFKSHNMKIGARDWAILTSKTKSIFEGADLITLYGVGSIILRELFVIGPGVLPKLDWILKLENCIQIFQINLK